MKAVDMLGDAFQLALDHPKLLVPWAVISIAEIAWVATGGYAEGRGFLDDLYFFAGLIMLAWASAVTVIFVRGVERGEPPDLTNAAKDGLGKTPSVVFLYIAWGLVILVAAGLPALLAWLAFRNTMFLLVLSFIAVTVWAVFLWVKLLLSEAALVLDELGIRDALRRAWEASRGHFWPLLRMFLIVGLVGAAVALVSRIPYVGVLITVLTPLLGYWVTAAWALAYLRLEDGASTGVGGRDPKTPPRVAP